MNIWCYALLCAGSLFMVFLWGWREYERDTLAPAIILGVAMVFTMIVTACLMWACFIVFGG